MLYIYITEQQTDRAENSSEILFYFEEILTHYEFYEF